MRTVYITEDDASIRQLVTYALKTADIEAVGFETGASLFEAISQQKPDLLILDIMLPDIDGISILRQIRDNPHTAEIPVLMLTAKSAEYDKVNALDLGADDYVTKPFGVMELISRVKALLRRTGGVAGGEILSCGRLEMDAARRSVLSCGEAVSLTYKEFELLHYLLKNKGIVLSRDRIMQVVWGFDFEGESRTVDMHIKLLRQKLGEAGGQIKTVRGVGYKLEEDAG